MRLTVLACLTAWCHAQPRPSLLQVSARQTAMEKAEAESRSQTLSGFQKFTDSLVEQYKSGQAPIAMDDTTKGAIEQVLSFIDSFFPHADAAHQLDTASIETCKNQDCGLSCELDHAAITDELGRLTGQTSVVKKCIEENQALEEQHADDCYAYDWYRKNIPLPACVYQGYKPDMGDICAKDDPSEKHPYLGDFCDGMMEAEIESQELAKMEECLVAFNEWFSGPSEEQDPWTLPANSAYHIMTEQERYDGIYDLYQRCQRPEINEENQVCQEPVNEYHRDHCEYALVLNHECKEHRECMQTCGNNCDICDDIKIKAGARKADNETGERIKCLLKVLIDTDKEDKTTALEACTDAAAIKRYELLASHFNLTCDGFESAAEYVPPNDCANAEQPISCSIFYMEQLLQMQVITGGQVVQLQDFDLANTNRPYKFSRPALWNSCDCGHKCTAAAAVRKGLADIPGQDPDEYKKSGKCQQAR